MHEQFLEKNAPQVRSWRRLRRVYTIHNKLNSIFEAMIMNTGHTKTQSARLIKSQNLFMQFMGTAIGTKPIRLLSSLFPSRYWHLNYTWTHTWDMQTHTQALSTGCFEWCWMCHTSICALMSLSVKAIVVAAFRKNNLFRPFQLPQSSVFKELLWESGVCVNRNLKNKQKKDLREREREQQTKEHV